MHPDGVPGTLSNTLTSTVGGAFAGAATHSVLKGTSFGDNLLAVLPDVIGATIGNAVARAVILNADAAKARARELKDIQASYNAQAAAPASGEGASDPPR